jgi:prepilin-type N-terminal cleavage/methylation domain-containing protein
MSKIYNLQFKVFNSKAGFTVLESIIAITVVSLAISGAFSAVRTGLSSSTQAKEQTKAFYLAQEAFELIRNRRDSNILDNLINNSGLSWRAGISNAGDPCAAGRTCRVDVTGPSGIYFTDCGVSWDSCPVLKQDGTSYLMQYSSGLDTVFKREVQIENTSADEISVTIRVSWSHAGIPREFKTKTILTNWL